MSINDETQKSLDPYLRGYPVALDWINSLAEILPGYEFKHCPNWSVGPHLACIPRGNSRGMNLFAICLRPQRHVAPGFSPENLSVRIREVDFSGNPISENDHETYLPFLDGQQLHQAFTTYLQRVIPGFSGIGIEAVFEEKEAESKLKRLESDLKEIALRFSGNPTEREAMSLARVGQGRFRSAVLAHWNQQCAVTGCSLRQVIIASHCKPWATSTDAERLDPYNGLPLIATLDKLFDKGLIGFTSSGEMRISPVVSAEEKVRLGIPQSLNRPPSMELAHYLDYHLDLFGLER